MQTKYPVKDDSKASAKIASLINASPLNSYGDDGDKKAIYPEVRGRQLQNIFWWLEN
ncbi:MgpC family cytadherence protein [Mycoplasmoides pneumoniae]|uniref:MgpC family cytadherence protein n=1 Tax=Mycoplasmoides pneumoniae TaxID=2104 RepID=UPI000306CE10|nr:MgpC family cytadherence protein [Mycoplasmoides pneumoniae]